MQYKLAFRRDGHVVSRMDASLMWVRAPVYRGQEVARFGSAAGVAWACTCRACRTRQGHGK